MKRSLAIAFLSLYAFNLFGYMATFLVAQSEIRREIKQRIKQSVPAEELVLIRVTRASASALEWIKSFEFRYRGGLYDVVRTEQAGDTTLYYCINDVQEERLFAGLDGHVRRQMESDARTSSGLAGPPGARSSEYLPVTGSLEWSPSVVGFLPILPFLLPVPPVQDVPSPPPRLV